MGITVRETHTSQPGSAGREYFRAQEEKDRRGEAPICERYQQLKKIYEDRLLEANSTKERDFVMGQLQETGEKLKQYSCSRQDVMDNSASVSREILGTGYVQIGVQSLRPDFHSPRIASANQYEKGVRPFSIEEFLGEGKVIDVVLKGPEQKHNAKLFGKKLGSWSTDDYSYRLKIRLEAGLLRVEVLSTTGDDIGRGEREALASAGFRLSEKKHETVRSGPYGREKTTETVRSGSIVIPGKFVLEIRLP